METFSRVTIRGTVIRKISTAGSLIFVVATENREAKKTDYPRFVAFTDIADLDKVLSVGDRVTVEACFYTSKKHPEGTLIPLSVRREKSKMEAVFEKEVYLPDMNEFVIRGELTADPYIPNNRTAVVTLKVEDEGKISFIRAVAFGRAAGVIASKKKGELVDAVGYIRTIPSNEANEQAHTQSTVIINAR